MNTKNLKFTLAAVALFTATAAQSQHLRPAYSYPAAPEGSGPAAVQMGDTPLYFTPYIGVAYGRDDNLFTSDIIKRASNLYIISPGVKVDARSANAVLQAAYQGQIGRYTDSEDDNYIDHTFRSQLDFAIDRRNFVRVNYDYLHAHDPRGSTDRLPSGSPDKYNLSTPSFLYAFGAPGAQGRLEAYYSDARKRYTNNRDVTFASDRNTQEFGGVFYWRVMPRSYALFEARRTDLSYLDPASPFNSTEYRYFGGVAWEATAATTGTVKIGRIEKRFESGAPTFTGTAWEASVVWAPRTYSKFDFYSTRTPTESTGLGNFILSDITGVNWTHAWSSVVNTGVDARFQKDRYKGVDRTDETYSLGFKVGYKFRRWLTLGAEYTYTNRDSNRDVFDYDRNFYLLTATASM
jgi:hypothetical protein